MNAIALAVEPLRAAAVEAATLKAREFLTRVSETLVKNDGDLNNFAPYPNGNMMRKDYVAALNYRKALESVTKHDEARYELEGIFSGRPRGPYYRRMDFDVSARFVKNAQEDASSQFDAYIAKLNAKIGEVKTATLEGNFVWSYSIITVTKEDGSVENWKTQMILNVSVLGKLFNQFPTRKVK